MKKIFFASLLVFISSVLIFISYWPGHHETNLIAMKELKNDYPPLPVPESGMVLLIYAHSDDELGTIAQVARLRSENPALRFKWYIVSDGGRGLIYPGTCGDLTKPECRLMEAKKVSECAGIPHPESLNLSDGNVSGTKNLSGYLKEKIPELSLPDLKYIFTHDNRGLYGHSDHLAVYDAVKTLAEERNVPLVTLALPQYFKDRLILTTEAESRSPAEITHQLILNKDEIDIKICASRAHASQKLILNLLMFQGLEAREFFEASPREFLNLD